MDNMYRHAAAEAPPPRGYGAGYLEAPYAAAHDPAQPDHTAPPWGYDGQPYGFRCDFPAPSPGAAGFGAFGFDPSVPPPPFCPPGPFPPAPISSFSRGAPAFEPFTPQFRPGPHTARYDLDPSRNQLRDYEDFSERGALLRVPGPAPRPEDQAALQRRQDLQWLGRFLQGRDKPPQPPTTLKTPQPPRSSAAPDPRAALYRAAALVSRLAETCEALSSSVEDEAVWADSYVAALRVKTELQEQLQSLGDGDRLARWKAKLARVARRRARRLRAREALREEEALREDRLAEKDAAINAWRLQQVQRVEEKKKEQELKLAADTVLCEVRKKQADVKRMQDILRSLEKLRRLRKEAAARKGIDTEQECDEAFSSRLERLRSVMKKRTAVYSAEEKALMVMLEGEQEEERRREQEKRTKKERERHLQRKRRVSAMLFGEDLPAGSVLQPFREYHTQAERSLHALLQIRSGWDTFVVPADHPDGSPVPQGWILPDAPSDPAWASALLSADAE